MTATTENSPIVQPYPVLGEKLLSTPGSAEFCAEILDIRKTAKAIAEDRNLAAAIDVRMEREGLLPPPDIQHDKYQDDRQHKEPLTWMGWLAIASTHQVQDVVTWNHQTLRELAADEQWYQQVRKDALWTQQALLGLGREQRRPALLTMADQLEAELPLPRVLPGAPLDPCLAAYRGLYKRCDTTQDSYRVVRRDYDINILTHELIHGLGGFLIMPLNEGATQRITNELLDYDIATRQYYAQMRKESEVRQQQGMQAAEYILPENCYPSGQQAVQALCGLICPEAPDEVYVEDFFTGEDIVQNTYDVMQAVHPSIDIAAAYGNIQKEVTLTSIDDTYFKVNDRKLIIDLYAAKLSRAYQAIKDEV